MLSKQSANRLNGGQRAQTFRDQFLMRKSMVSMAVLGAVVLAAPAAASVKTLSLTSGSSAGSGDYYFTDGTVTARVSAWSINPNGTIRAASLGVWDYGLGVEHGSEGNFSADGNHTTDNKTWKDFLVFQFSKTVELEDGWFYSDWDGLYDTDATIGYRFTGDPYTTAPSLAGLNQSALSIFTQFASNDNTGNGSGSPDSSIRNINTGNNVGNVWLIGASFTNTDQILDGFKLKKITYNVAAPPVPEPSTWALLILGFGGVGAAMRKRKQQAVAYA